MSGTTPYLGSKISLISKSEIRYEGVLYTVDTKDSTIALAKVRSFGTENRPTEHPVSPTDDVYEYIIFKASDIKDLTVCATPNPMPPMAGGLPYDPAIVKISAHQQQQQPMAAQPQVGGFGPFGGFGSADSSPQKPLQSSLSQQSSRDNTPAPARSISPVNDVFQQRSANQQQPQQNRAPGPIGQRRPAANVPSQQPQQAPIQQQQQIFQHRAAPLPDNRNNEGGFRTSMQRGGGGGQYQQQQRYPQQQQQIFAAANNANKSYSDAVGRRHSDSGGQGGFHAPQQHPYHQPPQHQYEYHRGGGGGGGGGYYRENGYGGHGGGGRIFTHSGNQFQQRGGGHFAAQRGGGGGYGSYRNANGVAPNARQQRPAADYDFESANAQFQETLNEVKDKLAKTRISPDHEEEHQDAEEEVVEHVPEAEDEHHDDSKFYDKRKSFFDTISCEAIEKMENSNQQRHNWRKEREVNVETFGPSALRRFGFRGGYYRGAPMRGGFSRGFRGGFSRGGYGGGRGYNR